MFYPPGQNILFGWINILYDRIKYYTPRLSAHINLPVKERPSEFK